MVTRLAALSTSAAAASEWSSGRTTAGTARTGAGRGRAGASARNTSPGMTTTPTPPRCNAARIAISSSHGTWSGTLACSQYTLHSPNSCRGWVSWK
jgi:hypothetical protein